MIFRMSTTEKIAKKQKKYYKMINGIKLFALLPKKLENGSWVWLEYFWRYYNGYVTSNGTLNLLVGRASGGLMTSEHKNYLDHSDQYVMCQELEIINPIMEESMFWW